MDQASSDIVHHARAVLTGGCSSRIEHHVVHDQLTSSFKKITEGHGALRPVEYILLLDLNHWQIAPGLRQTVALMVEVLFPGEEFLARFQPFVSRHSFRKIHLPLLSLVRCANCCSVRSLR